MAPVLIFLGVLALLIGGAIVANRLRGVSAHYLDTWDLDAGEHHLAEDDTADFYSVPRLGQARVMTFLRTHRTHAVVTDRRIVIAQRTLAKKRWMIIHEIYLDAALAPAAALRSRGGGLGSLGYTVVVTTPAQVRQEQDGDKQYLRIEPVSTASSTNIDHLRLYSDHAAELLAAVRDPARWEFR